MLFNSVEFITAFILFFIVYWAMKNRFEIQNRFLLAASYLFYAWWDWRFLTLIIFTTSITYLSALRYNSTKARRWYIMPIVMNLLILCAFKYFGFFTENLNRLLMAFGWNIDWITVDILLPVGISFYTLQAISYTIDVKRSIIKPTHDPVAFATFMAFFPQLLAGPIERASQLLPQISRPRHWRATLAVDGAREFLWGLFKKVAVADPCGVLVDRFYGNPNAQQWHIAAAALLFAIQIYCDFSGYSNMARGLAAMLGIRLSVNFDRPYFTTNIRQFWRHWHITLMQWLRDYVYIPLGGRNHGRRRALINIFIIYFLSGLWHGAGWNFILWGTLWGTVYIIYTLLHAHRKFRISNHWCAMALTIFTFAALLIPFRVSTLDLPARTLIPGTIILLACVSLIVAIGSIAARLGWNRCAYTILTLVITVSAAGILSGHTDLVISYAMISLFPLSALICFAAEWHGRHGNSIVSWPRKRLICVAAYEILILLIILSPSTDKAFIYYQF